MDPVESKDPLDLETMGLRIALLQARFGRVTLRGYPCLASFVAATCYPS